MTFTVRVKKQDPKLKRKFEGAKARTRGKAFSANIKRAVAKPSQTVSKPRRVPLPTSLQPDVLTGKKVKKTTALANRRLGQLHEVEARHVTRQSSARRARSIGGTSTDRLMAKTAKGKMRLLTSSRGIEGIEITKDVPRGTATAKNEMARKSAFVKTKAAQAARLKRFGKSVKSISRTTPVLGAALMASDALKAIKKEAKKKRKKSKK
jgi:hypothetical protein